MAAPVIVHAGPLAAFLVKGDRYHDWVRGQFARLVGPLISCEEALAEAIHLIRRAGGALDFIFEGNHTAPGGIMHRFARESSPFA